MAKIKKTNLYLGIAKFFTPIAIGLIVVYFAGLLIQESLRIRFWPLISAYFFPPLGKESIIPTGIIVGIDPLIMALSIAFVDIIVALFLLWNYDLTKKIPLIGNFVIKVENIGHNASDKYGWIKPLRFIGIVLFVMVPFQGSGGLVGSILGRLFGMKPLNTFFAISAGAIVGCLLIAYLTNEIKEVFLNNFLMGMLIVVILLLIGIMVFIYRKNRDLEKN